MIRRRRFERCRRLLLLASAECEELPALPFVYLAEMALDRINVRTRIYGTEMDVHNTDYGIKAQRGWKTDPSEIALYESEWSSLQGLAADRLEWCL